MSCKTILIVDVKKYPPDAESLTRAIIVGICKAEVDCNRKAVSTPLHAVVLPLLIVVAVSIKLLSVVQDVSTIALASSLFGVEDGWTEDWSEFIPPR